MHKTAKELMDQPLITAPPTKAAAARSSTAFGLASTCFRLALCLGVVGSMGVGAGAAQAQTAAEMTLPPLTKDPGLRSGDFVLHPSVSVMGHYDTNIFNGNSDEKGNVPKGATSIRIIPRLALANDLQSDIAFHFAAAGDGRFYLSENENIKNLRDFGGNAALDVAFGQRKPLTFAVFNNFNRALHAANWDTRETLNRVANDIGARVEFHPGEIPERRPFLLAIMGSYGIDRFADFTSGDTNTIHTRLTGSWKFLPKTAALVDASWDFRNYATQQLATIGLASNSKPFRARVGLAGALTKRTSFDVRVGWGSSLSVNTAQRFGSVIGSVNVGFLPAPNTRLVAGFARDFRDSFYGSAAESDRGSISLKQRFGTIMDVTASFGAAYVLYGAVDKIPAGLSVTGQIAGKQRHDVQLDGGVSASFEVARYWGLQIGYTLRSVITPFALTGAKGTQFEGIILDTGAYTGHEIFASAVLRY